MAPKGLGKEIASSSVGEFDESLISYFNIIFNFVLFGFKFILFSYYFLLIYFTLIAYYYISGMNN